MLDKKWVQLSLFSTVWSAIIFSQVIGQNAVAWVAYLGYLIVMTRVVTSKALELKLMILIALMGMFIDASFLKNELFVINQEYVLVGLIPFWLIMLWSLMQLVFHYGFQATDQSIKWIRLGVGAIVPFAYLFGDVLGLMTISKPFLFYVCSALVWFGIAQLLYRLRQYITEGQ